MRRGHHSRRRARPRQASAVTDLSVHNPRRSDDEVPSRHGVHFAAATGRRLDGSRREPLESALPADARGDPCPNGASSASASVLSLGSAERCGRDPGRPGMAVRALQPDLHLQGWRPNRRLRPLPPPQPRRGRSALHRKCHDSRPPPGQARPAHPAPIHTRYHPLPHLRTDLVRSTAALREAVADDPRRGGVARRSHRDRDRTHRLLHATSDWFPSE